MKLKIILLLSMLSSYAFADICPSVDMIKKNQLQGWQAYDSDEKTLLSKQRYAQFKTHADAFILAEWVQPKTSGGEIHCYYRAKSGSALDAYLAKTQSVSLAKSHFWYPVSGAMHCAAPMQQCRFINIKTPMHQFAEK